MSVIVIVQLKDVGLCRLLNWLHSLITFLLNATVTGCHWLVSVRFSRRIKLLRQNCLQVR